MKKFLSVLFCVLILMSSLSVFASAASVNAADSSTDISGILSMLGELFSGSTDLSKLFTSFGELLTNFFAAFGEIIEWKEVGSSLWSFIKNTFSDISTTINFFFAELYNG
jgi:hypothetical protein